MNYIWHIDFSWNKVVRIDITGLLSKKCGNWYAIRKVWEPLLYAIHNVNW